MLDATFAYPTGGAEAIALGVELLAGKKPPHRVTLGTRLFTQENVERAGEELK